MDKERYDKGFAIRSEVLGPELTQSFLKNTDEFSKAIQELAIENCWGDIWGRAGLPRKTRSIITIAMLAALNRPHEIKMHILGALNNGVTKEEIKEVFLQAAVYCGLPAGVDSFRIAKEVFKERGL